MIDILPKLNIFARFFFSADMYAIYVLVARRSSLVPYGVTFLYK